MSVNPEQYMKAPSPICSSDDGNDNAVSPLQLRKAVVPIVFKPLPKQMLRSEAQQAKASSPMLTTELGMVSDESAQPA